MYKLFLLITMIFCHIVDDFYLQGILASLKQKQWWEEHYPDKRYKNDYIAALIAHAFSWSFLVHLTPTIYAIILQKTGLCVYLAISFLFNTYMHASIDHKKANKHAISLCEDQALHVCQIIGIWIACMILA